MSPFYLTLIALIAYVHSSLALYQSHTRKQWNAFSSPRYHGQRRPAYYTDFIPANAKHQLNWNIMPFTFPSYYEQRLAEYNGNFIPTNAIPADVQPYYDSRGHLRVFLTLPKFKSGLPYTLAEVVMRKGRPVLKAYPYYKMHDNKNGTNCDAITSAFRMAISECGHMWVIDSGMVGPMFQCPPQLLVFDLKTNRLIHRHRFNESLYDKEKSLFITPLVNVKDRSDNCLNAMVYVADYNNHGLVVYDRKNDEAWRIDNRYMYPIPEYINQTVAGTPVTLRGGIFGMGTDKKNLYFNPLASKTEYSVPLEIIENKVLFQNDSGNMLESFKPLGERNSACLSSAMDSQNNMYCVTLDPIELLMWNVGDPYNSTYIKSLPIRQEELEFVSGIKVIRNPAGSEELWMLSNRYQITFRGQPNWNEIHFRAVVRSLDNISSARPVEE